MSLLEKAKKKKKELSEQMQRGRIVTEQMKAERMRKRANKKAMYEPGTLRYGLTHKQNPIELMQESYERRKSKREERQRNRDH